MAALMDPRDVGLLNTAFGLMAGSGPSRMPVSFGQVMGQAGQQGVQAYQQAQSQNVMDQLRGLQISGMQASQQDAERKRLAMLEYAKTLPPEQQQAFLLSPDIFLKEKFAGYNLKPGEERQIAGQRVGFVPQAPTLHNVPTGVPGVEQPTWLRPGESQGVPVGGMKQPEILNPQVLAAKEQLANAGATRVQQNVQAFTPANEEAQRRFMDSTRTNYEALRNAPVTLKNIEEAKALVPKARGFMGTGGETMLDAAKFLNNRLGFSIATEGVKGAEELRSRIFTQIMDNLKKMDAQPSQMQQMIMMDALGKLGTDPNALPAVLDAFGDVVRGKVDIHNREVAGAEERGVKFPYNPKIDLPGTPQAAPKRGDVQNGWEFLGGDPSNRMNWRKK